VREEVDWDKAARASLLLKAVSCWRKNSDSWFAHAYERLPETVRVNPLSGDQEWLEDWLKSLDCEPIEWFNGVGSAWTMPFPRGKAEGDVKSALAALHETGRLTRQEAVSMLPVLALDPKPGEYILDLCASPGSKTSQIAEHLNDSGVVVANEIVRGRVNLLVSNMQRHRSRSNIIVNHDARHFPKVPEFGYDRILVDAPCTGTGTTRKNPDVWSRWKPSGGRSMQKLQIDILSRATKLVKSGGRVVYSTCSLDPIENEAVVAEVLRNDSSLKLISAQDLIPKLLASEGMTQWPVLSDECSIVQNEQEEDRFLSPSEKEIIDALPLCMRVWNDESTAGGFFLAVIEKKSSVETEANTLVNRELTEDEAPVDNEDVSQPISSDTRTILEEELGALPDDLWVRGKKVLLSTAEAHEIWSSERSRRGGRTRIPGRRWRPLKVVYLGLEAIHLRRGEFERVVGSAAKKFADIIEKGRTEVPSEVIDSLLSGDEPEPTSLSSKLASERGNFLLVDESDGTTIPVWIGGRVSLMMRTAEVHVLRLMRGIIVNQEE
jgi:16S rRNA C967 or C1407 C5-methylase (RsmB/RsmF family)